MTSCKYYKFLQLCRWPRIIASSLIMQRKNGVAIIDISFVVYLSIFLLGRLINTIVNYLPTHISNPYQYFYLYFTILGSYSKGNGAFLPYLRFQISLQLDLLLNRYCLSNYYYNWF